MSVHSSFYFDGDFEASPAERSRSARRCRGFGPRAARLVSAELTRSSHFLTYATREPAGGGAAVAWWRGRSPLANGVSTVDPGETPWAQAANPVAPEAGGEQLGFGPVALRGAPRGARRHFMAPFNGHG